jgi:SAM-dependent methyltransferase
VSATLSKATTLTSFTMHLVDDGRHSLPKTVRVSTDTGQVVILPIHYPPAIPPALRAQGQTATVAMALPALTGTTFTFSFPTVASTITTDAVTGNPIELPIGVADIVLPGVTPATTPSALPGACTSGLLAIDGKPVPIRITGPTADALDQRASAVTMCGGAVSLGVGTHQLTTAKGYLAGWNLDTLALKSGAVSRTVAPVPTARVTAVAWSSPVALHATVGAQPIASWLVLNQSFSRGWSASLANRSLGAPMLLDGGFTAWRLPPSASSAALSITWTPQRTVDLALLVSIVGMALVLLCIVLPRRRRRANGSAPLAADHEPLLSWPWRQRSGPSVVLAAIAVVAAMAFAGPAVAVVAIPVVALAWWRPQLRPVLAVAPGALLGAVGAYVVYEQRKYLWPHNLQWPTHFGLANTLAWVALSLLLVDLAAFGDGGEPVARRGLAGSGISAPAQRPDPSRGLARIMPARLIGPAAVISPKRFAPPGGPDEGDLPAIALPGGGIARSVALLRAFRQEQDEPDLFYRTIALDTLHRLTGAAPLFNRVVVDIGGGAGYFAEAFRDSGAHVVLVEPEAAAPLPRRLSGPEELMDERQRHERAVWPGRLLPGDTVAGDGLALPLPNDLANLVFSSNVLEHVADPGGFIDEAIRVAKPGGLIYLSFTVWWSPWGGHETSPWHLLGGRFALRRYTKRHGHPPKNVYGTSLFALRVGTALKLVKHRRDASLLVAEPRYLPRWARFVVRVPVVREFVTWNLAVLLEKL